MGRGRKAGIPKPHPHRASGQDRVLINGNHEYLGPIGSEESKAKYQRLLAKWLAAKQADVVADPSFQSEDITIAELALAHLGYCDRRYRNKRGEPTGEADNVRDSIRELLRLFRDEPAREFGPKKLRAVRKAMVEAGLSRSVVNRRIKRCVRVFKWGVGEELLSPSVHQALAAVEGLRAGERVGSQSPRETAAVKPVEDMRVDAVKPFVSPQIWAMIELLRFTGMRPGEKLYEELSLVEEETIPTPDEKIRIFGGQGLEEADRAHPTSRPCGADQPCKNRVSTLAVIRDTYPSTSNDAGQVIEPAPKQAPPLGVS